jgi:FkbM family methyltransferase
MLGSVRRSLERPGGRGVLGLGVSLATSVTGRRPTRVRWTGSEWSYRFGGRLLLSNQLLRPATLDDDLEIALWGCTLGPGGVVVDIGAGTGTEAVPIAGLVGPEGRVIAVEAHPDTARVLRRAVEVNGLSNVEVVEIAISDQPGTTRIGDSPEAGTNSIMGDGEVTVECDTVDAVLDRLRVEQIDLLKMNIEGAERLAIRGMERTAPRTRRMVISCHDFLGTEWGETRELVGAWLTAHGFTVVTRPEDPRPWCRDYLYATATAEL